MWWEKGEEAFNSSKVFSDGPILPLGVLEDDSWLQKNSSAMHKFLSACFCLLLIRSTQLFRSHHYLP
jgi:hypothetical protein